MKERPILFRGPMARELPQLAAAPSPSELVAYLRQQGWALVSDGTDWAVCKKSLEGEEVVLEVPQQAAARDYARAVGVLLDDIARLERRSPANVLWDVKATCCDAPGCRDDWDDVTDMDLSVQHLEPKGAEHLAPVALPTLHAIGLGPQLAELERICAASAASKHAGESIRDPGAEHHWLKAAGHLTHDGTLDSRDPETNARHIIHAAARLLMAAACLDADGAIADVKDCLTATDCLDAEGET